MEIKLGQMEIDAVSTTLNRVRDELYDIFAAGRAAGRVSFLIAVAGLLNWCPRCG